MAGNNLRLGKVELVEQNLHELIRLKKKYKVQGMLVYDDYNTLFRLFLRHNPHKVVLSSHRPPDWEGPCSPTTSWRQCP